MEPGTYNLGNDNPYKKNLGDYKHAFREDNDNPTAPEWFRWAQTNDPDGAGPFTDPISGNSVPSAGCCSDRFWNIPEGRPVHGRSFDDPADVDNRELNDWYHEFGFTTSNSWESPDELFNRHMAGDCIDLATEEEKVQNYINSAIFKYLDMGVDAIRVDTAKHLPREELIDKFVKKWQEHKPGLFVFGEVLAKSAAMGQEIDGNDNTPAMLRPWYYTRTGSPSDPSGDSGMSVLDFSLFATFRESVAKGSFSQIGGTLQRDNMYADATELVTFLHNHDHGPDQDFAFRFGDKDGDSQWRQAIAYNVLWTVRGIPTLYYGSELEFQKGMPSDIGKYATLVSETGRAYFGDLIDDAAIGSAKTNPLFKHIKRLNMIRKEIPALRRAPMSNVSEWGSGLSFVRDYNDGESYVVVGLSAGSDQSVTVEGVRDGNYKDAVTGSEISVSGGKISFNVKANSAGIYVLDGKGKIGEDGVYLK